MTVLKSTAGIIFLFFIFKVLNASGKNSTVQDQAELISLEQVGFLAARIIKSSDNFLL